MKVNQSETKLVAQGFPGSSVGKESACSTGDQVPSLGEEDSPGAGNSNPLQYSCLENLRDRGAWRGTVHGVARVGHKLVTKPPSPRPLVLLGKGSLD